ncbi:hypothetical protein A2U01_0062296, partial [Trifolium medium]|nr:hypothetical protein [Trifolium medium]
MFTANDLISMERLQSGGTRMIETIVPETESKISKVGGRGNWVEITKAITSHGRNPRLKIKYRETKWIKGNRNIIVS